MGKGKNKKTSDLSPLDWKIIDLLKHDGKLSDAEIARELKLTRAAVRWRRKRLEREGYLWVTAYLNCDKLNFPYAFILLRIAHNAGEKELSKFRAQLLGDQDIFEIYETIGDYDLLIGVSSKDLSSLKASITSILKEGADVINDYIVIFGNKTLKALRRPLSSLYYSEDLNK